MNIQGKTALVTGASSGMGAAISMSLAKAGATVLLLARNVENLETVAHQINAEGLKAHVYPADVGDMEAVKNVTDRIKEEHGTPDILVNNAGGGLWRFVEETTPEEAVEMMRVPYFAAFNITHAFMPEFLHRNSGHIVNISSIASRFVWPGATAYIAARWAIRGFSEALRADLYDTNIKVTLYESGVVESPYWNHNRASRERVPKIGLLVPALKPKQVGEAVRKGIEKNKHYICIPFMMRLTVWQHAFMPWLVQRLMTVTGYRRRA